MAGPHIKKLKLIELGFTPPGETPGTPVQFECQVSTWNLVNNTEDGEKVYTFCPDGELVDEVDQDWALELTAFADWRSEGLSEFLWEADGQEVDFTLVHHPGILGEEQTFTGKIKVKAPSVGGEVRTNEAHELTFPIIGKPVRTRSMDTEV